MLANQAGVNAEIRDTFYLSVMIVHISSCLFILHDAKMATDRSAVLYLTVKLKFLYSFMFIGASSAGDMSSFTLQ